ncbi:MAG: methyltransferase domain-containing protein [Clostridia bacterium]|nr:methyltransferase domain-containing protein [Clostridia bacterium]
MAQINDAAAVKGQYARTAGLDTRISLHDKYSENKQPFGDWLLSQYDIPRGSRLLELGCGTAVMWRGHTDAVEGGELILSDLSEAMLDAARQNTGAPKNIRFERIDIQSIPYPDACFDIVIANMMLYHVPDLQKALGEVRRVLRPGGRFYCATFGEHGHNWHIARMLEEYGVSWQTGGPFTLQNGAAQLASFFPRVELVTREDALRVTDAADLADYVLSLTGISGGEKLSAEQLRALFEAKMTDGALRLPKEYGLFICSKTENGSSIPPECDIDATSASVI